MTPTERRRQRLSSSETAPAECSAAISSRAMSLRISTGKVSSASVSRSPALKAKAASPSGRPLRSSARTVPASAPPALARRTLTVSAPAALSAPASARAGATPPSITVSGRCSIIRPSVATNSLPPPRSTPSLSQTSSTSGVALRKRPSVGKMSRRSTAWGFGLSCLTRTRAAAGVSNEMSRVGSDIGISATPRWSASARAMRSSAVRMRASQVPAAGKPSSISKASGALAVEVATGGFHSGPAAAMITSAASVSRSKVSHHGVRRGCSSLGVMSNSSRVGGKSMRRGCGGMSRSSHHSTGRLSSPSSTSGCANPSGSHGIMRASRPVRRHAGGCSPPRPGAARPCGRAAPAAARPPAGRCGGWRSSSRACRSRP